MPLVGLISADGTSDQPEGQGHCSFEFALELAKDRHEAFPYPYPLVKGIVDGVQNRGEYISATSVLHCLRADFLKRRTPFYQSIEALYPAFRGTLFHALMEKNVPENGRIEEKVKRTHRGIEIGGTFDSLLTFRDNNDTERFILQDWKTTDNLPKYGAYPSHVAQVNIYRWLLGLDPEKTTLEVHYFSMKGHKACPLRESSTRGGRTSMSQYWSDEQVEAYLDDRLVKLKASLESGIPMPYAMVTEEEKWECAYCPVRQECATGANAESEAIWRKNAGLPPTGAVGEESAAWLALTDSVSARLGVTK